MTIRAGRWYAPGAMGQQDRPTVSGGHGDPWAAFSYLFGGMAAYGGIGWLLDWWLGTGFFVPIGLLAGTGGALYLVYARFWRFPGNDVSSSEPDGGHDQDEHRDERRGDAG